MLLLDIISPQLGGALSDAGNRGLMAGRPYTQGTSEYQQYQMARQKEADALASKQRAAAAEATQQQNLATSLRAAAVYAKEGHIDIAQGILAEQQAALPEGSRLAGITQRLSDTLATDPGAYLSLHGTVDKAMVQRGWVDALPDPSKVNPADIKDGHTYRRDADGNVIATPVEGIKKDLSGVVKDHRKEIKGARDRIKDISAAKGKITAAYKKPSAAGDLALIFSYMKILDPGSTVREGEFANAQNSGGVDQKVRSLYNSIINGQRLSPPMRQDFYDRSVEAFQVERRLADEDIDRVLQLADQDGIPRVKVMGEKLLKQFDRRWAGYQKEEKPPTPDTVVAVSEEHGEITEADIQATMAANKMTREQVLQSLGVANDGP